METSRGTVREEFTASAAHWVAHLRTGGVKPPDDEAGPRHLVNLSHRMSDTLPTYLADAVESFVDEFWTACELTWPSDAPAGSAAVRGALLDEQIAEVARQWIRLQPELAGD